LKLFAYKTKTMCDLSTREPLLPLAQIDENNPRFSHADDSTPPPRRTPSARTHNFRPKVTSEENRRRTAGRESGKWFGKPSAGEQKSDCGGGGYGPIRSQMRPPLAERPFRMGPLCDNSRSPWSRGPEGPWSPRFATGGVRHSRSRWRSHSPWNRYLDYTMQSHGCILPEANRFSPSAKPFFGTYAAPEDSKIVEMLMTERAPKGIRTGDWKKLQNWLRNVQKRRQVCGGDENVCSIHGKRRTLQNLKPCANGLLVCKEGYYCK